MPTFEEALLKERLWTWLEDAHHMRVDGEVNLGTGRIDLVAETPDGEYWGIELKSGESLGFGSRLYDQVHRYLESEKLDRLYLASDSIEGIQKAFAGNRPPDIGILNQTSKKLAVGIDEGRYSTSDVLGAIDDHLPRSFLQCQISAAPSIREYIKSKLDSGARSKSDAISLEQGIIELQRAQFPAELGVIHVPQNISGGVFYDVERHIDPNQAYEPRIVRDATPVKRVNEPPFNRREEPWVRHCCWRTYGGLPEGHVPNVMESDQPYRPIDLLAFPESPDPTDAIQHPEANEIVGIEAKGESSYQPTRVRKQLSQFLQTECLSRLYLAVPQSIAEQATELIANTDELEPVGVFSVSEGGELHVERKARRGTPIHDGYLKKYTEQKIGYGSLSLAGGSPVENPYVTTEEAERLENPDAASYAREILADLSAEAGDDGWIRAKLTDADRPPESEFSKSKARSYLLAGKSAAPYVVSSGMKEGFVRLTVSDFTYDDEPAVKLHFGAGSWEGAYIWLVGDELRTLRSVLISLQSIAGGSIEGLGKTLDLETFPFEYDENEPHRVSGSSGEESVQELRIERIMDGDVMGRIRLGESASAGVDVELSEAQWFDLIATVDILLESGNHRELPGSYSSYPRIGPNGADTWSHGTDIEKQIRPELPE